MALNIPTSIASFCNSFITTLLKSQTEFMGVFIATIILSRRPRTHAEMGRLVLSHLRHRASISRRFQRESFKSRDAYTQTMQTVISEIALSHIDSQTQRIWVLIIDSIGSKRGGFTKIENARKYKQKDKSSRGKSSKAHTFLMGLLITNTGVRIPVPRKTYYTQEYCKKHNRCYRTQLQLASEMISALSHTIPEDVLLIVLADEIFEGASLHNTCERLGYTYIAPVCSSRCFADADKPDKGNKQNIHTHGKSLHSDVFKEICFVEGEEKTALYRRYSLKKQSKKNKRYYRVAHEVRTVSKLGAVQVVYSWKKPVYNPRRSEDGETFKVLVCNSTSFSDEEIVEWYDIRWQIELFFRELKGLLGLSDYQGLDFRAFEHYVDVVLLSFLYLEYQRWKLLQEVNSGPLRGALKHARTYGMQQWLVKENFRETLNYLFNLSKSESEAAQFVEKLHRLLRISIF